MIPERVRALFDFIDYLDSRKTELIEKYIPLCDELSNLDIQRAQLKPKGNYLDKQRYDTVQEEITKKFQPILDDIYIPVLNRLKDLNIWTGDEVFTSIWNENIAAVLSFKETFESCDVEKVMEYKKKYLNFRKETNSNFLCLKFVLSNLDEIYKALFDYFKNTTENEFESFETKIVKVNSFEEVVKGFKNREWENVRYELPQESLFQYQNVRQYFPELYSPSAKITNEIIMGHKIHGDGNILNTGNKTNINATIQISNGDLPALKLQLLEYGIGDDDIEELLDIVQTEQPNKQKNILGERANNWILRVVGKALSGVGNIVTGISSDILANVIRQYYGI